MKKWMKKMAIIGAILFVGGIGVTSIGAAIGGAAAGLDFLIDQEKNFQDKYNSLLLFCLCLLASKLRHLLLVRPRPAAFGAVVLAWLRSGCRFR